MDEVIQALADVHRRRILIRLMEAGPQSAVVQVPEDIVSDTADSKCIQIQLRHAHLPKLEQHGFIQWEQEKHLIRPGPKFDEMRPLLRLLRNHEKMLPGTLI